MSVHSKVQKKRNLKGGNVVNLILTIGVQNVIRIQGHVCFRTRKVGQLDHGQVFYQFSILTTSCFTYTCTEIQLYRYLAWELRWGSSLINNDLETYDI